MEPRNYESGASESAPLAPETPSLGYPTGGNPGTGTAATKPGPFWFHKIGESLRQIIVAAGLTPSDSNLALVVTAIITLIKNEILGGSLQSWQNVAASRALGVTYTNTTGRAILVNVTATVSNASGYATFRVNGVDVNRIVSNNDILTSGQTIDASCQVIVPNGSTYSVTTNGSINIRHWSELR